MSVVPKVEPEAVSDATTNPPFPSELASDRKRQSVDPPQSQPVLEQVSPSKASTLLVVAWIAASRDRGRPCNLGFVGHRL